MLAAALATISLGSCFQCARNDQSDDKRFATEPRLRDAPTSRAWFILYSFQGGPARFVSIGPDSEVLYVEATSPNFEVASVVAVRRGALPREMLERVSEVQRVLDKMDPNAVNSLRSGEAIENAGLFVDIAACGGDAGRSYSGLLLEAMPAPAAESLRQAVAGAEKLAPRAPLSLMRIMPLDSERAKQIRNDPRRFYTFVPVAAGLIESSPQLRAALQCPGLVVEADEGEDSLLREWLRQSNPRQLGQTLFLSLERKDFQVHFQPLPKSK